MRRWLDLVSFNHRIMKAHNPLSDMSVNLLKEARPEQRDHFFFAFLDLAFFALGFAFMGTCPTIRAPSSAAFIRCCVSSGLY